MSLLFSDNFDTGELYLWTLGAGWSLVPSEGGLALQVINSDEPVTFVHSNIGDAAVQARFLMSSGMARLSLRQSEVGSYTVLMDAMGNIALYRSSQLLGAATVTSVVPGQWRTLRLSAIKNIVRVAVDGIEVIAVQDVTPLPPGTFSFAGVASENGLLVDDLTSWTLTPEIWAVPLSQSQPDFVITATPNAYELHGLQIVPSFDALADTGITIFKYVSDTAGLRAVVQKARVDPYNTYVINLAPGRYTFTDVDDAYSALWVGMGDVIVVGSNSYWLGLPPFNAGLPDSQKVIIEHASGIPDHMDLFHISSGGSLRLYNVIIRNGGGTDRWGGGGIVNWGDLSIYNSVIEDNQANMYGGAIFNNPVGNITAINTVFRNNLTRNGTLGGAISSRSSEQLNFSCVTFQDNLGGAIFREANPGSIIVNNSNFINNIATSGYGAFHNRATAAPTIDARQNWWGADSNPSTIQGTPNAVSSGVDYSNRRSTEAVLNCTVPPLPSPLPAPPRDVPADAPEVATFHSHAAQFGLPMPFNSLPYVLEGNPVGGQPDDPLGWKPGRQPQEPVEYPLIRVQGFGPSAYAYSQAYDVDSGNSLK